MKNKLILFVVLLLIPFYVNADSISIVCDNDVVKGNSLRCTIKGDSDEIVTAVSAKVRTGSNISFSSFTPDESWQGDGEEGKIDLYTAQDITGNFVIGTLNLNVKSIESGGNSTITVDSVFYYDEDGYEKSINPITKTIRIASTINNLSSLTLSTGNLNPSFSSNVTSYSATIDSSSVTINAKAESSYSSIGGDIGKVNLNYGNNKFNIVVTSEAGTSKTYTINIVRPNNTTTNNSGNTSNNTNNTNNNSSNNNITTKSSNANLKDISLSHGNIVFDKDVTEYKVTVHNDIQNIEVTATTEDDKSKVEISGNSDLVVGENVIEIVVTAEDGTTKKYIINVERAEVDYILSNNNNIASIEIKDYDFIFNKNILDYTLKIKDEESLDIDIVLEDINATYSILNNSDLRNNSVISIIVTAEDGTMKTYSITIKSNDRIIRATFIMIIIILLIINLIRLFLMYRREKSETISK